MVMDAIRGICSVLFARVWYRVAREFCRWREGVWLRRSMASKGTRQHVATKLYYRWLERRNTYTRKLLAVLLAVTLSSVVHADIPRDFPVRDRVAVIELNHVYSNDWKEAKFVQWIFWDFNSANELKVVDWRWWHKRQRPYRDRRGRWVLLFSDQHVFRRVVAVECYETHSNYDRETVDRKKWPLEKRRRLSDGS